MNKISQYSDGISIADDIKKILCGELEKGDVAGHAFHGNQHTGGGGAGATHRSPQAIHQDVMVAMDAAKAGGKAENENAAKVLEAAAVSSEAAAKAIKDKHPTLNSRDKSNIRTHEIMAREYRASAARLPK